VKDEICESPEMDAGTSTIPALLAVVQRELNNL
jgi:hypothetical protein